MTFPSIRTLGTTLLASAGVAGIAIGIAARPLFENLVAGVQLALTQPIRIDDVVVVEKQFGRIEEIHSTYVVVRLWDLRRMVLPLTYFINTPFENWTRNTANVVGEVYVFTDWTFDVASLRAELPRILAAHAAVGRADPERAGHRRDGARAAGPLPGQRAQLRRAVGPALLRPRSDRGVRPRAPARRVPARPRRSPQRSRHDPRRGGCPSRARRAWHAPLIHLRTRLSITLRKRSISSSVV